MRGRWRGRHRHRGCSGEHRLCPAGADRDATSKKKEGGQSQADYLAALRAQGEQELAKHTRLENFRFTPTGSITVGMVVEASLPGTDIQAAARITSVTLSSQKGENSVSTEIGTPIIRRKQ